MVLTGQCHTAFQEALKLGLIALQQDMEVAEKYDHDKPNVEYGKKNEYFNRVNNIGMPFLQTGLTGISKMYFWRMLNAIGSYEKNKPLNKGMACGNLGVSALAEGDFDGGIAYLLWAGKEDRAFSGDPTKNIFANDLYVQFSKAEKRGGTSQFGGPAIWIVLENAINEYNITFGEKTTLDEIFKELEASPEQRSLLEGSLWVIHRNLILLREENARGIYKNENNIYTRLRLFDGIASLCRFIELRMRSHETFIPPKTTLGSLLINYIFKGQIWLQPDVIDKNTKPQTPSDLDILVQDALKNVKRPGRAILLLLVIRNYSVHICDPETPIFFSEFENIFNEIMIAYIHYLKFKKVI
jgi:hypothetical protein